MADIATPSRLLNTVAVGSNFFSFHNIGLNMAQVDKDALWAGLDELGEEQVRIRVAQNLYGIQVPKRRLVDAWLLKQERMRAAASDEDKKAIDERAVAAAELSAKAAQDAANIAGKAHTIAILALSVSVVGLIISIFKGG